MLHCFIIYHFSCAKLSERVMSARACARVSACASNALDVYVNILKNQIVERNITGDAQKNRHTNRDMLSAREIRTNTKREREKALYVRTCTDTKNEKPKHETLLLYFSVLGCFLFAPINDSFGCMITIMMMLIVLSHEMDFNAFGACLSTLVAAWISIYFCCPIFAVAVAVASNLNKPASQCCAHALTTIQ